MSNNHQITSEFVGMERGFAELGLKSADKRREWLLVYCWLL
jgi:hypothetical protein